MQDVYIICFLCSLCVTIRPKCQIIDNCRSGLFIPMNMHEWNIVRGLCCNDDVSLKQKPFFCIFTSHLCVKFPHNVIIENFKLLNYVEHSCVMIQNPSYNFHISWNIYTTLMLWIALWDFIAASMTDSIIINSFRCW